MDIVAENLTVEMKFEYALESDDVAHFETISVIVFTFLFLDPRVRR